MLFRDKDKPMVAKGMFGVSLVTAFLATLGAAGYDLYLASTQWILVGILLSVWGIYILLEAQFRL
jgi:hypothetical protein